MSEQSWRSAVVRLRNEDGDGQGVLVTGGLVLTAAHCVTCDSVFGAALGDYALVSVTTASGDVFRLSVMFMDPFVSETHSNLLVQSCCCHSLFPVCSAGQERSFTRSHHSQAREFTSTDHYSVIFLLCIVYFKGR